MRRLILFLQSLEKIEWYGCSIEGDLGVIPSAVWRFATPNVALEATIAELVARYEGNIDWEIYQAGRNKNWVLAPVRLRQLQDELSLATDSLASATLARDQSFARLAAQDAEDLTDAIIAGLAG